MSTLVCLGHNDATIVYQGGRYSKCPLCETHSTIDELNKEVSELEDEVYRLTDDLLAAEALPPKQRREYD